MINIVVVDDEKEIADLITLYLENENYNVFPFYDSTQALDFMNTHPIDLAILDIMMPEMDGLTLVKKVRELHHFPILLVSAKDGEVDKITGLMMGADDYITKPFQPLEIVARVKAQLRRYTRYNPSIQKEDNEKTILTVSDLSVDTDSREVYIGEKEISLTPTEFAILKILMENNGKVVSSESLFKQIWQDEYYVKNNNTITVHVRHLREKLGDTLESSRFIKTIWGVGYKIEK